MSAHLRSVPIGPVSGNTKAVVFTAHQVSQSLDISATQLVAKSKSQSIMQDHKMNLRSFFLCFHHLSEDGCHSVRYTG